VGSNVRSKDRETVLGTPFRIRFERLPEGVHFAEKFQQKHFLHLKKTMVGIADTSSVDAVKV